MTGVDALLVAIAEGDRGAFERFYDQTSDLVFGIARRVVIDRDLAAEVTQDVYLEVWRKAGAFDAERGSARTWLAVMTKRRAIDAVRSVQSSRNRDENQVVSFVLAGDPVGESVADHEDRARVMAALSVLTDLQREALDLAFYGAMTHREVAEWLDVPLGTVKTRIRDGLARLASAMGGADG